MSGIPVNDHEIFMQKASEYIEYPENVKKTDPEEAKRISGEALIRSGVLNKDGSKKERIVTWEEGVRMVSHDRLRTRNKCTKTAGSYYRFSRLLPGHGRKSHFRQYPGSEIRSRTHIQLCV